MLLFPRSGDRFYDRFKKVSVSAERDEGIGRDKRARTGEKQTQTKAVAN